jgi:hypothetical protein
MEQIRRSLLWVGLGLLVGSAACSLPFETQTECLGQDDCLAGYTCLNSTCIQTTQGGQTGGGGSSGTGGTGGTTSGGTTGNYTSITPVSSDSLVTCADPNTLSNWAHSNGPATHLSFVIQPVDDAVGEALCPVAVAALDDAGAIVTSNAAAVSLSDAAGSITGEVTTNESNGVAVFSGLRMTGAGAGQVITATQGSMQVQSQAFKTHTLSWTSIGGWDWTSTIFYDASSSSVYAYNHLGDYRSADGGATWASFNMTNEIPIPGVQSPAALFGYNNGPALSVDGGNTFTAICGNLSAAVCTTLYPRAVDATTGALVAMANNQYIYVSQDRGSTWNMIIDIGAANAYYGFIAVSVGNNILYTAQRETHALIIAAGLTTNLASITVTPASPNAVINDIVVDPRDANTVYIAATDGLFVSHDRGQNYSQPITGCASVVAAAAATGGANTQVYAVLNDCLSETLDESPTPGYVASIDSGSTWQNAGWGLQPTQPDTGIYQGAGPTACNTSIAPDPSGNGSVYLSLGWCGGVFHSASGGVN